MNAATEKDRYALVTCLAQEFRNRQVSFGKTALQKMVFLLQALKGVNAGYEFSLYTYGPFSRELMMDLDLVELLGGITTQDTMHGPYAGIDIMPGPRAEEWTTTPWCSAVRGALQDLVDEFGARYAVELELFSTIVFVDRDLRRSRVPMPRAEFIRLVRDIKPRFSEQQVKDAITMLESKGYLDSRDRRSDGGSPSVRHLPPKTSPTDGEQG